jgi:hypothetical protein
MAHIIVFTPLLQGKVLGSLFQKQKLNLYLKERKIKVLGITLITLKNSVNFKKCFKLINNIYIS